MVEIEPAYDKIFTNVPLEEDILYAIGYNWFAQLVALTQKMSYIKEDFTPIQILETLEKVGYFPHITIEELFDKINITSNTTIKNINENVSAEIQKPTSAGDIVESYPQTSIKLKTSLFKLKEDVKIDYMVTQNIIPLDKQNYNKDYVSFDENNNMSLLTRWNYHGEESVIDTGHLFVITPQIGGLADIRAVTIND